VTSSILVTGAAGFIGSHLSERLVRTGHRVVGIDCFDSYYSREQKESNLQWLRQQEYFEFVECDITEFSKLATLTEKLGEKPIIVHLAAKAGVRPSIQEPIAYQHTNVQGTQNLLELAKTLETKQFVFASSSSVYGINPGVPWSEEHTVLKPISPYASTKVSGELLGHVYSHLYGIRFIGLRFFTVYGPRQRPDLAINKFTRLILKEEPIPFFGDGSTRRDYTFIEDIIDGIVAATQYSGSDYELVNLGNNQTISLSQLVATLEKAIGKKANLDRFPEQPGDVPQTWANITKAQSLFGYSPKTDIESGLTSFVKWYQNE